MGGPGLLIRAGLLVVLLAAAIGTPADADLWGHITFGRDIVAGLGPIQPDRYSFTSDRPWINHEWLAEVLFFEAYRLGGATGLIVLKLSLLVGFSTCLWLYLRRAGVSPDTRWGLLVLACVGTYWRTHNVRPQLFSVVIFALLLMCLTLADSGRRRYLLAVPPLMALWVNLHGGWIVGIGLVGLWTGVRTAFGHKSSGERLQTAWMGVAALGATLLNPYGLRLWWFLAETVRLERADIEDWGSILGHPIALGAPWALSCVAGGLAVWRGGRPARPDYGVMVVALAVAAFRVGRLDAFFALAVVILLAPQVERAWMATAPAQSRSRLRPGGPSLGALGITAVALLAMLIPAVRIAAPFATCVTIGGAWAPEAEAARFVALNRLGGRMLTWYDWGEYAIWHFAPDIRVSMDGRRETVYSPDLIQSHWRFFGGEESARPFLTALDPDFIWVPRRLPIATRLDHSGWTPVFNGPISVIFARDGMGPFRQPPAGDVARRCFPGP